MSRQATSVHAVPAWGLATSTAAPVLLVGGWTVAARLQPGGFDPVTRTISELAALGMPYRWVMTLALVATGLCQLGTALALRPAARAGRFVLACGGAATVLVGLFPLPESGGSLAHSVVATVAFVALAVWPWWGLQRGPDVPWGLRPAVAVAAGGVLVALVLWFFAAVVTGGPAVGLAERVAAAAQTAWPFVVVLSAWTAAGPSARLVGDGRP